MDSRELPSIASLLQVNASQHPEDQLTAAHLALLSPAPLALLSLLPQKAPRQVHVHLSSSLVFQAQHPLEVSYQAGLITTAANGMAGLQPGTRLGCQASQLQACCTKQCSNFTVWPATTSAAGGPASGSAAHHCMSATARQCGKLPTHNRRERPLGPMHSFTASLHIGLLTHEKAALP